MTNARFRLEASIGHEIDINHVSWGKVEKIYGRTLPNDVRRQLVSATCRYVEARQIETIPNKPAGRKGAGSHILKILEAMLKTMSSFNNLRTKDIEIFKNERAKALKNLNVGKRSSEEIEREAEERAHAAESDYREAYEIAVSMIEDRLRLKGLHFPEFEFSAIEIAIAKILGDLKTNPGSYGEIPGTAWRTWVLSVRSILKDAGLPSGSKNEDLDRNANEDDLESFEGRRGYLDRLCYSLMREFVPEAQREHASTLSAAADAVLMIVKAAKTGRQERPET